MRDLIQRSLVAAALVMSSSIAFSAVTVEKNGKMARYQFWVDGIDVQKVLDEKLPEDSQTVYLQGLEGYVTKAQRVGEPEIPVIRFYVDAKGDIEAVGEFGKSSSAEMETRKVSGIIKPVQPPRIKKDGVEDKFVINEQVYNQNFCYGSDKLIHVERAGSVKGWDRHVITVFPMCYKPQDQELVWRKYIRLRVTGNLRQDVAPEQELNETIAFVVGKQFKESNALKRYIDFKEKLGYVVRRVEVDGTTVKNANDVRAALQELYRSSDIKLKYALLIGDSKDVPSKPAQHISGVTDHYYRAIDTDNYETDINGPDIGVGRLSASSEEDLEGIVNKYIRYEIGTFEENKWHRQIAFLGTNDYTHWELAEATHNWVLDKHLKKEGFTGNFPQTNQPGGDTLFYMTHKARTSDIMKAIKEGRAIVNYSGHGATTFWDAPRMTQSDVRSIENTSSIPFVISNSCITSQFTVTESFGETWQRHPYGAVVFWGSMDSTYWDEDDVLEKRMYDGIFENGNRTFQEITQHALSQHWLHFGGEGLSKYYWETYVMLGDPSMSLRLNKSERIRMHGPSEITADRENIFYMVTDDDGQPVRGVRVAMKLKGGDLIISTHTNEHGIAKFDLRNIHRGAGTFVVSAALHDAGLFQSEVRISAN